MKHPAVYIMASGRNGTLYIGVTSDLIKRVWQHREGVGDGFTKAYGVKSLVWYEQHETMESAISREKAMKKWLRKWKLEIIEKLNPQWNDLWPEVIGERPLSTNVTSALTQDAAVIPANAGIQNVGHALDSRVRGNDGVGSTP